MALLLVMLSPWASGLASALPSCPLKALVGLPCPTCGTTRAGLALAELDPIAALVASPLAAAGWIVLVGGGLVAGGLAMGNRPISEPRWIQSAPARWALVAIVLANWVYLVGAGS